MRILYHLEEGVSRCGITFLLPVYLWDFSAFYSAGSSSGKVSAWLPSMRGSSTHPFERCTLRGSHPHSSPGRS